MRRACLVLPSDRREPFHNPQATNVSWACRSVLPRHYEPDPRGTMGRTMCVIYNNTDVATLALGIAFWGWWVWSGGGLPSPDGRAEAAT